MALPKLASSRGFRSVVAGHGFFLGQAAWHYRPQCLQVRQLASQATQEKQTSDTSPSLSSSRSQSPTASSASSDSANQSMPSGWEDDPDYNITDFSRLPNKNFGYNQEMKVADDFKRVLRSVRSQFRAPIRYCVAYGSGVFSQASGHVAKASDYSPHPNPPEAVQRWQKGGHKIIDFLFGVSYTQHWHDLNLRQHRDHYSFLGGLGSNVVSHVQDDFGAGVYFNPYITVNGIMIKYGVVNLDTIRTDLTEWNTLYIAGRMQKPVKIVTDDPGVKLANQVNLMGAVRTALLLLPETFTETQLYTAIAGISYMGDPRMSLPTENPCKVSNIVTAQLANFRTLYDPLITDLPNLHYSDPACAQPDWKADLAANARLTQSMDPKMRGNMVRRLPKAFRQKLYYQYQAKFQIPGSAFDSIIEHARDEDATSFRRREGGAFEQRIAADVDGLGDVVRGVIRSTVKWPSTTQSLKGLLTGGPRKSWRYLTEKWTRSREGGAVADKGMKEKKA
ncbi:hypothetical protein B0A49_01148 [Cryomyces minteri]|uniref:Phosphatidate cytidylyltransferase, mitochondrial n=2 Tax=Cryomyces minteri TaxID=331657 RepID=A0A4U0XVP0_9PEZI|nr:hypothetical protein B0A49_01148 [Cryomyces minteri]